MYPLTAILVTFFAAIISGHTVNCWNGYVEGARLSKIKEGIEYLRHTYPYQLAWLGPGQCARVSCSQNSAIHWCNDNKDGPGFAMRYNSIADGAQVLVNECADGSHVAGVVDHPDNWRALVYLTATDC
ncbi:hypothetical protein BJX76DRAFT_355668 [Aspergillus varians]